MIGVADPKGNPSEGELSGGLPVMSLIMKRLRRYPATENQSDNESDDVLNHLNQQKQNPDRIVAGLEYSKQQL